MMEGEMANQSKEYTDFYHAFPQRFSIFSVPGLMWGQTGVELRDKNIWAGCKQRLLAAHPISPGWNWATQWDAHLGGIHLSLLGLKKY